MLFKGNLITGMVLGAAIGAYYVQTNKKAQVMMQKGKAALKKQVNNM